MRTPGSTRAMRLKSSRLWVTIRCPWLRAVAASRQSLKKLGLMPPTLIHPPSDSRERMRLIFDW
ncbi:MAG: hypothetical protein EA350_12470 [Gemmatimonadales bacterium]|nr:MAG: hypothetical protein EA350_12470 [Gemmatimonadales bacterium]